MFSYILRNRAVALFFTFVLICISFLLQMAYKKQKKKKKSITKRRNVLWLSPVHPLYQQPQEWPQSWIISSQCQTFELWKLYSDEAITLDYMSLLLINWYSVSLSNCLDNLHADTFSWPGKHITCWSKI